MGCTESVAVEPNARPGPAPVPGRPRALLEYSKRQQIVIKEREEAEQRRLRQQRINDFVTAAGRWAAGDARQAIRDAVERGDMSVRLRLNLPSDLVGQLDAYKREPTALFSFNPRVEPHNPGAAFVVDTISPLILRWGGIVTSVKLSNLFSGFACDVVVQWDEATINAYEKLHPNMVESASDTGHGDAQAAPEAPEGCLPTPIQSPMLRRRHGAAYTAVPSADGPDPHQGK